MVTYRPDVDGLRAVAVVPVLLFHAGVAGATGGYVGVDVFFVISGFLITSILWNDLEKGAFSIVRFYERRCRRILPALFVVGLAVMVVGAFLFLPAEYRDVGKSLAAVGLFGSNILFWREAGYFDRAAEEKPLLHTWSLGVEEQFYILFPIALFLVFRYARRWAFHAICAVLALSFALNVLTIGRWPEATFYLLPMRAWELMLGAMLAVGHLPPCRRVLGETLSLAGLAAIVWAIVSYTPDTPFPGWYAAAPALGTAAILYAGTGPATLVGRLLSLRLLVGIGLISYSLYLWHVPLLVFVRLYTLGEPTAAEIAGALALSAVFATLSWWLVEQPVRRRRVLAGRGAVFAASAAVIVVFVAGGGLVAATGGLPGRVPVEVARLAETASAKDLRAYTCVTRPLDGEARRGFCPIGAADGAARDILVWGDSHAMAALGMFDRALSGLGRGGWLIAINGCPPLIDLQRVAYSTPCDEIGDRILQELADGEVDTVVLVAAWYGMLQWNNSIVDGRLSEDVDGRIANIATAFGRTVRALDALGLRVIVMLPVPGGTADVPATLARAELLGRDVDLRWSTAAQEQRIAPLRAMVAADADAIDGLVDLGAALCADGACRILDEGVPLYVDSTHLSTSGNAYLVAPLERQLACLLAPDDRAPAYCAALKETIAP